MSAKGTERKLRLAPLGAFRIFAMPRVRRGFIELSHLASTVIEVGSPKICASPHDRGWKPGRPRLCADFRLPQNFDFGGFFRLTVEVWSTAPCGRSNLLDELGFQLHGADAIDFAVDVVVAIDQADVLDLGADLDDR